jgi:uncharacterized membrane protein YkoI
MKYILFLVALMTIGTVSAADSKCSIHPTKGASASALRSLAKISMEQARATALSTIEKKPSKVVEEELEAEDGCLVYSFDIQVTGISGVEEVLVDAGNGSIVSRTHETPEKEAAEHAQDAKAKK